MKFLTAFSISAICLGLCVTALSQDTTTAGPYKVISSVKVGGAGSWDYVYADSAARRLYIPRGNRVTVYDLDSLQSVGEIPNTARVHGVAVDPVSGHGFCSSNPVVMFDSKTLATIKTIDVQGSPDGIHFDPQTGNVYILSHRDPNITVIKAADGSVLGTIDLGGGPEQGEFDGQGHFYVDLEDQGKVAVVDTKTLKMTGSYDLAGNNGPGGLALDAKNRVIFSYCHDPAVCVILNADTGAVLKTLPTGSGVDAAEFNPATGEAFSSQGDGTLTVIKENGPTDFVVEQNVKTKQGARTSTLDSKTNQIYLVTADFVAPTSQPTGDANAGNPGGRRRRGRMVPGSFTILVVGKAQ